MADLHTATAFSIAGIANETKGLLGAPLLIDVSRYSRAPSTKPESEAKTEHTLKVSWTQLVTLG